ncbi:MAG: amidohydrolase family protein [Patescibacteria group bacterium]
MLIDAHTHIRIGENPENAAGLVGSLRASGIDKAFVLADHQLDDCTTEQVLREIKPFFGTLYAVATISSFHPQPSLFQFEEWLWTRQIYGLKFYPGYEHYYPDAGLFLPYLELLQKYNRPAMFHSGDPIKSDGASRAKLKYAHPIHIDDVATDMPELKIIICHMGYSWVIDAAEVCYKNPNVWVDVSGFVYGKFTPKDYFNFQHFLGEFRRVMSDPSRLIFGTDWPVVDDHDSYLYTMRALIPAEERELFFCHNAARVFGVEEEFGLK